MSEIEKGDNKDSKMQNLRIGEYIGASAWRAVPIFAFVGLLISFQFKLTMNKDVWFWFFSSIAQTFAALVALVAIFLISRLDIYNAIINKNNDVLRTVLQPLSPDIFKFFDDGMIKDTIEGLISNVEAKMKTDETNFILDSPKTQLLLLKHLQQENKNLEQKKETAKIQMGILLEHTVIIIMLSIFLIPFGAGDIGDSLMLALWNNYNLKWVVIFGIVGLCISSLHKVESILKELIFKEG